MFATAALAVAAAAAAAPAGSSAVTLPQSAGRGDAGVLPCPECVGHRWEVLQGVEDPDLSAKGRELAARINVTESDGTHTVDNGVDRDYGDGYSEIVAFLGYSVTPLCARYDRTRHINGHTNCSLKHDWYKTWQLSFQMFKADLNCWVDDMATYQDGNTLSNAPGTTVIVAGGGLVGICPLPGQPAPVGYKPKQYDWRYGGIRPQDNGDETLFPPVAKHIEDVVAKTGKKVVIRGCSGGTVIGYAFIMSQTREWRDKHIMAFVPVDPLWGGTPAALSGILEGWEIAKDHPELRCIGRKLATRLASVLWLWPRAGESYGMWKRDEVLVETPSRKYSAYDLEKMLDDMGLPLTKNLLNLEKNDLLGVFEPPYVDTYAFYGYGIATPAGWKLRHNLSPETDGPEACPPKGVSSFRRPNDDGDFATPRRSCARADVWADAHEKAGVVLKNYGFRGDTHGCGCSTDACEKVYQCVMDKLAGKPHEGC